MKKLSKKDARVILDLITAVGFDSLWTQAPESDKLLKKYPELDKLRASYKRSCGKFEKALLEAGIQELVENN